MCGMYVSLSVQGKVKNWKILNLAQFTRNERKVHKMRYVNEP